MINEAYNDDIYKDRKVMWNGDSSTYTLINYPRENECLEIKTKKDKLGNTWTYKIVKSKTNGYTYLIIEDEERGYSRAYKLSSDRAFQFTEDGVWFASDLMLKASSPKQVTDQFKLSLTKISYDNDHSCQDGKVYDVIIQSPNDKYFGISNIMLADGSLFLTTEPAATIVIIPFLKDGPPTGLQNFVDYSISGTYGAYATYFTEVKDGYLYYGNGKNKYKIKTDGSEKPIMLEETKK